MRSKVREKERAIMLRKKGLSYNDILKKIPVAKSSLSLWLSGLPLTDEEKIYLKKRRDSNISRGRIKAATALRRNRLEKEKLLLQKAKQEYIKLSKNPMFNIGISLYWAEGSKRSDSCAFMNSDSSMIIFFLKWLKVFFNLDRKGLGYGLYIHKHYASEHCEKYWAKQLEIPVNLIKIYFKPDNKSFKKRPNYKGCMRVRVPKSGALLFRIKVWQNMLSKHPW